MSGVVLRLRAGVVSQVIEGEMLLLDTAGGGYFELNRSGCWMLQRLLEGATREQTIASVEQQFAATTARVAADLASLLDALQQAGLVEIESSDQPAPV